MAIWQIVTFVVLLATLALSAPDEFDGGSGAYGIDHYSFTNEFTLDCGNATNRFMRVEFNGDAYVIFRDGPIPCTMPEIEPGWYLLMNAMSNMSTCMAQQHDTLELYSLDLTVQTRHVHFATDSRWLITCSYELTGVTNTVREIFIDNDVERRVLFEHINDTSSSTVTLQLRNTDNQNVEIVRIGDFVQLYAKFIPFAPEKSFRMWNCKAMTDADIYGPAVEYAILIQGCGDGQVMSDERGFMSTRRVNHNVIARSVFFRAFALFNRPSVRFYCSFLVRTDTTNDGPSCRPLAVPSGSGRRKRSAPADDAVSMIETDVITLLEPTSAPNNVLTYSLNKNVKTSRNDVPSIFYKKSMSTLQDQESEESILQQPLVIGLLATCVILIMVPLMIACGLFFTRTRGVSYVKPTYSSPPPIYLPESPIMVEKLESRLVC